MRRAIGYIRVSSEKQVTEGVSLDAQRERLTRHAEAVGMDLVAIHSDDGESASSLDRPAFRRALERLCAGEADVLLVTKLDRLTRSVADWTALVRDHFGPDPAIHPIQLISTVELLDLTTASGRMVACILVAVSQCERETTAERTAAAAMHKRHHAETLGSVPYGQSLDHAGRKNKKGNPVELIANAAEIETIRRIRELASTGLTIRAIAAALLAEGRQPRRGTSWSTATLSRLLSRPIPSQGPESNNAQPQDPTPTPTPP